MPSCITLIPPQLRRLAYILRHRTYICLYTVHEDDTRYSYSCYNISHVQVSDLIASSIKNGSTAVDDDDVADVDPTTTATTTTTVGTKSGGSGKRRSKGSKSEIEGITLDRVENYSALSKRELEVGYVYTYMHMSMYVCCLQTACVYVITVISL